MACSYRSPRPSVRPVPSVRAARGPSAGFRGGGGGSAGLSSPRPDTGTVISRDARRLTRGVIGALCPSLREAGVCFISLSSERWRRATRNHKSEEGKNRAAFSPSLYLLLCLMLSLTRFMFLSLLLSFMLSFSLCPSHFIFSHLISFCLSVFFMSFPSPSFSPSPSRSPLPPSLSHTLCLYLPLLLSLSLRLPLSLTSSLSLPLSCSVSTSLPLSCSHFLSFYLSPLPLSLTHSLSVSPSLSLSHAHFPSLPPSLSLSPSLTLTFRLYLPPSPSPSLSLSLRLPLSLTSSLGGLEGFSFLLHHAAKWSVCQESNTRSRLAQITSIRLYWRKRREGRGERGGGRPHAVNYPARAPRSDRGHFHHYRF